jgi:hypothetical protein
MIDLSGRRALVTGGSRGISSSSSIRSQIRCWMQRWISCARSVRSVGTMTM